MQNQYTINTISAKIFHLYSRKFYKGNTRKKIICSVLSFVLLEVLWVLESLGDIQKHDHREVE